MNLAGLDLSAIEVDGTEGGIWDPVDANTRQRKCRKKKHQGRLDRVAVLDMETDPFDKTRPNDKVLPFAACLYSDQFAPVVIWEENLDAFISKLLSEIEALPDTYTIYAHNGGKFDFMFLLSKLRGQVMFKGRGIMSAKVGNHELRDSFHIIPEKLAAYAKDKFDYDKMRRKSRAKHKDEIVKYLVNDCRYLFEIVKDFLDTFGFKISIGQAAMAELRKTYKVKKIMPVMDQMLRNYFFGGRVECLQGKGRFVGNYKLYDVNSMYPYVMAKYRHPVGSQYDMRPGPPGPDTIFVQLECHNSGALVRRGENNETEAPEGKGRFLTTIWEYNVALKYKLISRVKIIACIDCKERSNFSAFVEPLYKKRQVTKGLLRLMEETHSDYAATKRQDIFFKLIMNNAYGKFAQNPRRFKEHYVTAPDKRPEEDAESYGMFPAVECDDYWIWSRPNPRINFNNVGTAASITGAARAVLLEAIQLAVDPIYCDTDSLICKDLPGVELSETELGAWDIEKEFTEILIAGKKLYAARDTRGNDKIKSKGTSGLDWKDMLCLLAGDVIETQSAAPTLLKTGAQFYLKRKVRATAKGKRHGIDNQSTAARERNIA